MGKTRSLVFGHMKFELLIGHIFPFFVDFSIQIGEWVVFLFQYHSLTGTESLCNSLAGIETVEGLGGMFGCFCSNIGRQIYPLQSHFPSAMNTTL